jgi:hypothetical protein
MTLPTTLDHKTDFARQSIARNHRQQIIQSSFPAKLQAVLRGCTISAPKHVSGELQRDAAIHTADVAAVIEKAKFNAARLQEALDQAGDVSDESDLFVGVEEFKMNRMDEARRSVQLWTESLSLSRRLSEELAAFPAPAKAELERVTAEVREALIQIGSGPEAFQGARYRDLGAAQKQFDWFIRNNNMRTRAAASALSDAERQLKSAQSAVWKAKSSLAAAKQFVAEEMRRAVGDAVS